MTDPNDDLSSVADPGSMSDSEDGGGDLSYDEVHQADEGGPGIPGEAADGFAAQETPPD
ncbi:hypothetical protein AB0J80_29805 [Actinoplanes sp. NPDC049548]|uniref:hypothetical protein n=1 Tax=Actinoplanes sp. NPDC049548 TaxID=3155152 RepID=UPI0034158418